MRRHNTIRLSGKGKANARSNVTYPFRLTTSSTEIGNVMEKSLCKSVMVRAEAECLTLLHDVGRLNGSECVVKFCNQRCRTTHSIYRA